MSFDAISILDIAIDTLRKEGSIFFSISIFKYLSSIFSNDFFDFYIDHLSALKAFFLIFSGGKSIFVDFENFDNVGVSNHLKPVSFMSFLSPLFFAGVPGFSFSIGIRRGRFTAIGAI